MQIDIEKLAREAAIQVCRRFDWQDHMAGHINQNSPLFLKLYTALVLDEVEKAIGSSMEGFDALNDWCEGYQQAVTDIIDGICNASRQITEGK